MIDPPEQAHYASHRLRRRIGAILTAVGFLIFLLGADPGLFGRDLSPVVGFVQITVFTFGLFVICLGGTVAVESVWPTEHKSIGFEIGVRLVWTGFVLSMVTAMADVFGLGTRPLPNVPFFGYWQARGVLLGQIVIIIGFVLMLPFWTGRLDELAEEEEGEAVGENTSE